MYQKFLPRQRGADEDRIETSRVLATIVWVLLSAFPILLIGLIALPQFSARWLWLVVVIYAVCIPPLVLNRRGYTRFASLFLIVGLWSYGTGAALTSGGIASFAALFYLIIVFVSGLLLGQRAAIVTALLCILTALGLVVLEMTGHMRWAVIPHTPLSRWISITVLIVMVMGLQYLSLRRVRDALLKSRRELEERTRTESELRRVSERLQLATSAASIGIWDWDVRNDELVWDDGMYRLYGVRKDDFSGAGDAWANCLAPEDFVRANAELQAALRGEREFGPEFRVVWPDGSIHFINTASRTFRDEEGRPLRIVGMNYDITERKLAEERITLLQAITLDIASARDLSSALEVVLRRVCEKTGWALGQAWIPNEEGTALNCCPAWFAASANLQAFRNATKSFTFPAGVGLPGRVWERRQPVWIPDVTEEGNFPRADFARRSGLKAGLGVPILSGDQVVAVLEFFLRETRDEDERLVELISAVADQLDLMVERKRAEGALQRNEELFRAIVEDQTEMIVRWKPDGTRSFVNQAYCRTFGGSPEELIGTSFYPQVAEQYREGIREKVRSLTPDNPLATEIHESVAADGSVYWQEWTDRGIFDANGNLVELQSTGRDITERKRAEEALRESERRMGDTLTNIEMIAVMADMKGDITFVNDYLLRLTGWKREEAIGRNWFDMFLPEHEKEKVSEILKEVEPAGELTIHLENEIKTRSGEHRLVKWTNTTLRGLNGEVIGIAALGDDITERKAAEEQLKSSSEQLRALSERLRRAKEEEGKRIARELHDELGSALTSLKWSLLGLHEVYPAEPNPTGPLSARDKIEQMVGLVDDTINSVRRISSELRPGILDDLGVVAAIEWQTLQFHTRSGITCDFDSLADDVTLDREQGAVLFRIFQEAMTNILRHAEATKVNVIIEEEESELVLEVSDNGKGITEIEKRGTRSIGLLGMRERANSIGGSIEIIGKPGKGTKLIVRIPLRAKLLVDDPNPSVRFEPESESQTTL